MLREGRESGPLPRSREHDQPEHDHAAAARRLLHGFARGALRADEQDAAAVGDHLANERGRIVVERQGLFQVDDVDPVALPEDERRHLGVPETGLMSEVDARFQHLPHGHAGHDRVSCRG